MKKQLSVCLIMLILALTFTSCTVLRGALVKCEVKFDLNGGVGGEGFVESVTVKHGQTVAMPTPTLDNYTFEGWYADGTLYTENTPIEKDVVLKAKWSFNETYKISYNTNGKGKEIPAAFVKLGELPKLPDAPMAEGYVFVGWYLDEALTERYYFNYPLDEDVTLYAQYYDTTLGEYIVISTFEQLIAIKDDPAAKYLLACDINCHGEAITPVEEFTGELNGNGYKIYDFVLSDTDLVSGFIRVNKGTIKDLTFKDFVMDILTNSTVSERRYGLICGTNEGIIDNCKVLDGVMRLAYSLETKKNASEVTSIGSLVGYNAGSVSNSHANIDITASATINTLDTLAVRISITLSSHIGGIVGTNKTETNINNCMFDGRINVYNTIRNSYEKYVTCNSHNEVGGVFGVNYGNVNRSVSNGDIEINVPAVSEKRNVRILCGNAGGMNYGKVYNCYTTGDVVINGTPTEMLVGGFIGQNILESGYDAMINKCFSMSNVTVDSVPTNFGYFVGKTNGTQKYCYYLDTVTINQKTIVDGFEAFVALEPTTMVGEVKTVDELLSSDFILDILNFDKTAWIIKDGQLPKLR